MQNQWKANAKSMDMTGYDRCHPIYEMYRDLYVVEGFDLRDL